MVEYPLIQVHDQAMGDTEIAEGIGAKIDSHCEIVFSVDGKSNVGAPVWEKKCVSVAVVDVNILLQGFSFFTIRAVDTDRARPGYSRQVSEGC